MSRRASAGGHLADVGGIRSVWTYDRRDFSVYRVRGRALRIID